MCSAEARRDLLIRSPVDIITQVATALSVEKRSDYLQRIAADADVSVAAHTALASLMQNSAAWSIDSEVSDSPFYPHADIAEGVRLPHHEPFVGARISAAPPDSGISPISESSRNSSLEPPRSRESSSLMGCPTTAQRRPLVRPQHKGGLRQPLSHICPGSAQAELLVRLRLIKLREVPNSQ